MRCALICARSRTAGGCGGGGEGPGVPVLALSQAGVPRPLVVVSAGSDAGSEYYASGGSDSGDSDGGEGGAGAAATGGGRGRWAQSLAGPTRGRRGWLLRWWRGCVRAWLAWVERHRCPDDDGDVLAL